MRRLSLAAVSFALVLAGLTPLPAQASHESSRESLKCTATLDLTIEPGLSIAPSKGTFTTGEKPGPIECAGMLQGREVTGLGALGITGNYGQSSEAGDTCSLMMATGTYTLTLPTGRGPVSEKGNFAEVLGPTREGSFSAVSDSRENWAGKFKFSSTQGDCVLTPITAARVTLQLERGRGGDQPANVGLEGPGGAVVERGPVLEVAERESLHDGNATAGVEGDRGATAVRDEGVEASRGEQLQDVGVVVEQGATPDETIASEDRLRDLRLAVLVVAAVPAQMPPLWPVLSGSAWLLAW